MNCQEHYYPPPLHFFLKKSSATLKVKFRYQIYMVFLPWNFSNKRGFQVTVSYNKQRF